MCIATAKVAPETAASELIDLFAGLTRGQYRMRESGPLASMIMAETFERHTPRGRYRSDHDFGMENKRAS